MPGENTCDFQLARPGSGSVVVETASLAPNLPFCVSHQPSRVKPTLRPFHSCSASESNRQFSALVSRTRNRGPRATSLHSWSLPSPFGNTFLVRPQTVSGWRGLVSPPHPQDLACCGLSQVNSRLINDSFNKSQHPKFLYWLTIGVFRGETGYGTWGYAKSNIR